MKVFSESFKNKGKISQEQAYQVCGGLNVSPDLKWENFPKETKSFAIIVHDPDAPTAGGWYHWIIVDIPVDKNFISKGEKITFAKELKNDFGEFGYGGPCPPRGKHRYNFTVYALNIPNLDVKNDDLPKDVESKIAYYSLASSRITGFYKN